MPTQVNSVAVGTPVARRPRTDPYVKDYFIRLLPWVHDGKALRQDKDEGFGLWVSIAAPNGETASQVQARPF